MSLEISTDQNEVKEIPIRYPFPNPWWGRVLYGLFITVVPIFSFFAIHILEPEWQSGELSAYIVLLLFPEASLLFLILLAYSIICYLLLMIAPVRYSQSFPVRLGIYTGVLLALQYSIILFVYGFNGELFMLIPVWVSLPVVFWLSGKAIHKWGKRVVASALAILAGGGFLVFALISRDLFTGLFLVWIGLVMGGPFWSFLLALQATIWLIKNHETKFTLPHGLGLLAWLGVYATAWRYDILKMFELYAALPPAPPPDCYIATAAAQGHPRFVGSRLVKRSDGKWMWVNRQLQILKCAELALMGLSPRLRKPLRTIYDAVGRPLARRIKNPIVADIAYLLLKPWEILASVSLSRIIPEIDSISKKIYTNSK